MNISKSKYSQFPISNWTVPDFMVALALANKIAAIF